MISIANDLKDYMNMQFEQLHIKEFIFNDPIQIPHQMSNPNDIELAGLLTALMTWGNRRAIIKSAQELFTRMDYRPYEFVKQSDSNDLKKIIGFKYRTMQDDDILFILDRLHFWYKTNGTLEKLFEIKANELDSSEAIMRFRNFVLKENPNFRTKKHIANTHNNSAAKRLNMYLRWMVRSGPVDFGIWKTIPKSKLSIPLDVHSGRVARKLGLLSRSQNDLKAVRELDANLRLLDPNDPVKYDLVLFGLGVNKVL